MQNLLNRQFDRNDSSKLALNWRVLGLLNLYRILVPLVLIGVYSLGNGRGIAVDSPQLFFAVFLVVAAVLLLSGALAASLTERRSS